MRRMVGSISSFGRSASDAVGMRLLEGDVEVVIGRQPGPAEKTVDEVKCRQRSPLPLAIHDGTPRQSRSFAGAIGFLTNGINTKQRGSVFVADTRLEAPTPKAASSIVRAFLV